MKKIIAISGSLRKGSFNTNLLKAAQELAPEGVDIEIIDISLIPLFSQDSEGVVPESVVAFKAKIEASEGIIFATPEYNRSIPGVLKNAIDWASRPYGQNSFAKKKGLVLGATVAPTGTAIAQSHLKVVLSYLDVAIVGQPEFYLSNVHEKFDAEGKLTDESTREHLKKAIAVLVG